MAKLATETVSIPNFCCGGKWRFKVLVDLPRQNYDRRCPGCGFWFRTTRVAVEIRPGITVNVFTTIQTSLEGKYKR